MAVTTPNMNLLQPTIGVDSGLSWEQAINANTNILDGHNHTPGYGVQITPAGLNINASLAFQNNSATGLLSSVYLAQSSVATLLATYVIGNDLYYNDGAGNVVQLTTGGAVNATSSGISSGTATAAFSAGVLVVNAAASTPANIQTASILLGNNVASSKFLTLSPPAAMASNINQTLPTIPAATSFMQMDTSGNMSASVALSHGITGTHIALATITEANMAALSIGTAELINASVTQAKRAALGQQASSGCGSFNVTNAFTQVTNLSVTITTTGRPVMVNLFSDGGSNSRLAVTTGDMIIELLRDGVVVGQYELSAISGQFVTAPGSSVCVMDRAATAASHTYTVQAKYTTVSSGSAAVENCILVAYEL